MNAGKRNINDVFNTNKILDIPFFQRSYVWSEPQWERFASDMAHVSETSRPYFLGSVILKQQATPSQGSVGDRRTVIDGQQRLTTLNIYFKVLALKLCQPHLESIFRLPLHNNGIALQHNYNDINAFTRVMNQSVDEPLSGDDNVTLAFNYFQGSLAAESLNVMAILHNVMFVGIDLDESDDEQQIFDTINSLGVDLTTAELLKNYFFSREEVERYRTYWQNVFEADEVTKRYWDTVIVTGRIRRTFIDLFFYAFLQIKIQDGNLGVRGADKVEFGRTEGLFNSYKVFINKYNVDKVELMNEIREYAAIFRNAFDLRTLDRELPATPGIERLNGVIFGLETSTLIPYILYALKNVKDEVSLSALLGYLEAYIMRRMVCHGNTKNYNNLFTEQLITNGVLTRDELKTFLSMREDGIDYMPTDDEVREGFHQSKLINKQAAGILYFLESAIRTRRYHATALQGFNSYTLEHVMPKKWEAHWGRLSSPTERTRRDRMLLTLGNLTILPSALNSTIRNAAWDAKKAGKNGRPGLSQYATGLDTFSDYLNLPEWNEDAIAQRASFLADKALEVWRID